ncbi:hypothetical protein ACRALDRAFT_209306 [Sodiomyces alcalophilus JCM 7366]|uniref:uncharacterized protein n=1 Tax=Sodiomyces alcalophilus JCM 7366 TaxID=591952 RepID=UPI0039B6D09A
MELLEKSTVCGKGYTYSGSQVSSERRQVTKAPFDNFNYSLKNSQLFVQVTS